MRSNPFHSKVVWFTLLVVVVFAAFFLMGCRSTDPVPCVPQVIEGPPREITVVMPEAKLSPIPKLKSVTWTEEMIRQDVNGYVTLLWEDIQDLVDAWLKDHDELVRLNSARAAALESGAIEPPDHD